MVLVLVSMALLALGAASGCLVMPRLGMATAPASLRLSVLVGGVGPYLLAMWVYHWIFNRYELRLWTVYVGAGFAFLALLAWLSAVWDSWCPTIRLQAGVPVTWFTAVAMLAVGIGLVIALLGRERKRWQVTHLQVVRHSWLAR